MTSCPGCGAPYETPCAYCGARRDAASIDRAYPPREVWTAKQALQQAFPAAHYQQQYALMRAQTMEAQSVDKCIGNAFGAIFGGLR